MQFQFTVGRFERHEVVYQWKYGPGVVLVRKMDSCLRRNDGPDGPFLLYTGMRKHKHHVYIDGKLVMTK